MLTNTPKSLSLSISNTSQQLSWNSWIKLRYLSISINIRVSPTLSRYHYLALGESKHRNPRLAILKFTLLPSLMVTMGDTCHRPYLTLCVCCCLSYSVGWRWAFHCDKQSTRRSHWTGSVRALTPAALSIQCQLLYCLSTENRCRLKYRLWLNDFFSRWSLCHVLFLWIWITPWSYFCQNFVLNGYKSYVLPVVNKLILSCFLDYILRKTFDYLHFHMIKFGLNVYLIKTVIIIVQRIYV